LLYAIAVSVVCVNAAFIILDVTSSLDRFGQDEYMRPLRSTVPNVAFLGVDEIFQSGYLITSILSFILTWVATVVLLHHYSGRLGRTKYWIVVSIPLVYFLSEFQVFS
jgi:hypothetical protein